LILKIEKVNMKYSILVIILAFTNFTSIKTEPISNWKSYPMPTKDEYYSYYDKFQKETGGLEDWDVFERNDTVFATTNWELLKDTLPFKVKFKYSSINTQSIINGSLSTVEVNDGIIVAANNGEFGSSLWWFSKDGKQNYLIGDRRKPANADRYLPVNKDRFMSGIGNFNKILRYKNQIFGVTGLDHMTDQGGAVIKIEKLDDKWVIKIVKILDSSANFLTFDNDDNFFVGTSKGLYKVDKDLRVENLTNDKFWRCSDTFVKNDSIIYIGIRLGVLKIDLNSKNIEWLRPN
jgi:hypothetical protein